MNRKEHLLTILSEECNEVAQAVSKALRFGLQDHHPKNNNKTNENLIIEEYIQLVGTMNLLIEDGIIRCPPAREFVEGAESKKCKIEKWIKYAKKVGTVREEG